MHLSYLHFWTELTRQILSDDILFLANFQQKLPKLTTIMLIILRDMETMGNYDFIGRIQSCIMLKGVLTGGNVFEGWY